MVALHSFALPTAIHPRHAPPTLFYSYSESLSMQRKPTPTLLFPTPTIKITFLSKYVFLIVNVFTGIYICNTHTVKRCKYICNVSLYVYHIFTTVYKTARLHFPVTVYSIAPPFTANGQLHLQVPTGHRRVVHGLYNAPRY